MDLVQQAYNELIYIRDCVAEVHKNFYRSSDTEFILNEYHSLVELLNVISCSEVSLAIKETFLHSLVVNYYDLCTSLIGKVLYNSLNSEVQALESNDSFTSKSIFDSKLRLFNRIDSIKRVVFKGQSDNRVMLISKIRTVLEDSSLRNYYTIRKDEVLRDLDKVTKDYKKLDVAVEEKASQLFHRYIESKPNIATKIKNFIKCAFWFD